MPKPGRKLWDEKWLSLFISWAQAGDTGWPNTDVPRPHLIGAAYMNGLCSHGELLPKFCYL